MAIEKAARAAGHDVQVPFTPGRGDASAEMTDADIFEPLEPLAMVSVIGLKRLTCQT